MALSASQAFTAVPAQAGARGAARAGGLSRPEGLSPAAQALAPKKPSGFLQLFRKLAGLRKPPAGSEGVPAGNSGRPEPGAQSSTRKAASPETGEFRAEAARVRAASARKARPSLPGQREAPAAEAAVTAAPAARRADPAAAAAAVPPPAAQVRREQRPAQVRVVVVDLRARPPEGERPAETRPAHGAPAPEASTRGFERVLLAREAGAPEPGSAARPADPSAQLPNSLRERLVPEIVQRAGIVLREGGEGEIRLVLRPEHLGAVRIRLRLGESSLEGRIVVDNSNVKELLESNLEDLKSALQQEGYASANIDVTVSGGGSQAREKGLGGVLPAPAVGPAGEAAEEFQRAIPAVWDLGSTIVNLLA